MMNEKIIAPFFLIVLFSLVDLSCKSDEIISATETKNSSLGENGRTNHIMAEKYAPIIIYGFLR